MTAGPSVTSLQYLIFDLGSVLVEVDLNQGDRALSELIGDSKPGALAGEASLPEAQRGVAAFRDGEAYQAFLRGHLTPEGFQQAFVNTFNLQEREPEPSLEAFKKAWNHYLVGPVEGLEGLLERLGERAAAGEGPRLALLSNTDVWHLDWCEAHLPTLAHIPPARRFASCELGLAKPDPAIFLMVARQLGTDPDRCLMVDDLAENVVGARRAGMRGLRFRGTKALEVTLKEGGLL